MTGPGKGNRTVPRDTLTAPGAPAFAEVVVEPRRETPAACGNAALRITLPGGALIEMTGNDQLPLVVELLRALGLRLPC